MGIRVVERTIVPTWEEVLTEVIESGKPIRIHADKYHGTYRPRKKLEKSHGIEFTFKKVHDDQVEEDLIEIGIKENANN